LELLGIQMFLAREKIWYPSAYLSTLFLALMAILLSSIFLRSVANSHTTFTASASTQVEATKRALARIDDGLLSFRQGDYGQAEAIFSDIKQQLPDVSHALAMAKLLDLADATSYKRLLSSVYGNLALSQLRSRQFNNAEQNFRAAISIDPRAGLPRKNLGVTYLRMKNYSAAIREFSTLLRGGANDTELYLNVGRAHTGLGNFAKARWAFLQVLRIGQTDPSLRRWGDSLEARRGLAKINFQQNRLQESADQLLELLAHAPGDSESRYLLVQVLSRQGQPEQAALHKEIFDRDSKAIADIQAVLSSTPDKVSAMQWVADSYRELGLFHLAHAHYQQLVARDPDNNLAKLAIIKLQQRVQQFF